MARTVADQFSQILSAAGVKRIYGIVGDSLNGLTDAFRKQGKIEWLHVRHEEVAAFAAGAEAHLTDSIAVCAGSCGPGNLHLINGLFDCPADAIFTCDVGLPTVWAARYLAMNGKRRLLGSFWHG